MSEDTRTNEELNLRLGSYLCKPNDGYELDRREAQSDLAELKRRADEGQAARREIERYKVALDMLAGMNAPCQPWCIPHRDKDGCTTDEGSQTMGPCVPNLVKFTLAEADRIRAERGKA